MAHFMIVVLIITAALGLRSLSDGAGDNKLPLRIIARNGSAHSCPSKELLESERQAISATVQRKISGMSVKQWLYLAINLCNSCVIIFYTNRQVVSNSSQL